MSLVSDILQILTLDCRQSSLLLSESIDRPLRKSEKIALRMHTIGCWSCRRLKRQIMFIHEAARRVDGGHRGGREGFVAHAVKCQIFSQCQVALFGRNWMH